MKTPMSLSSARIPGLDCRLLYLVGQLRPGGLERQLCYLLQAMDRERYKPKVVVWNYNENDTYVRQIRDLGVQVLPIPRTFLRVAKLLAFCRLVRKLRPEVIHSYTFFTNFAAYCGILATRAVAVGSVRADFTRSKNDAGVVLGRLGARWPSALICNSFMAAKTAKHSAGMFVPRQVFVVRNGLDLARFRNVNLPNFPRAKILAVGSLIPIKRWDRLLQAAVELKENGFDFLVRIVGDGPLHVSLKQQAQVLDVADCVEFLGHRDDIPDLLADSCFLIHTSDSEGCPNVVIEAMASGRAVVATDAGDIPSLVEDGKTGFVVRRGDEKGLAERMMTLIADHGLCRRMGEAGRGIAEKEFGLDRLVLETFAAYGAAGWTDD